MFSVFYHENLERSRNVLNKLVLWIHLWFSCRATKNRPQMGYKFVLKKKKLAVEFHVEKKKRSPPLFIFIRLYTVIVLITVGMFLFYLIIHIFHCNQETDGW